MFGACHVTITCSTCRLCLLFRIGVGSSSGYLHVMPRQAMDSRWEELTTRLKMFTPDAQVGEPVCNKLGHMFGGGVRDDCPWECIACVEWRGPLLPSALSRVGAVVRFTGDRVHYAMEYKQYHCHRAALDRHYQSNHGQTLQPMPPNMSLFAATLSLCSMVRSLLSQSTTSTA